MLILEFFRAALRLTTPLLLASLGGSFTYFTGVPNMAMEGTMLIAAFTAFVVSDATQNSWLGLLSATIVSVLINYIYSVFVNKLKANNFAVGITFNVFLAGVAAFVLRNFFGESGVLVSDKVAMFPSLSIPFLKNVSILDKLLNNYTILIPLSFLMVVINSLIIYKTPFGYWLRAVGYHSDAILASGRNPDLIRTLSFLINGFFCGLAGAHLSIGYLSMFGLNMIAGRGFIALSIILFGKGNPINIFLVSLIFGIAETASLRIQIENLAPQFSLMFPYLLTILVLIITSIRQKRETDTIY